MKPPLSTKFADDFQTPSIALNPLIPYLKREWIIWECAEGKGYLTQELRSKGFNAIGTDILTGRDFLIWEPGKYDCIVTNPPYSLKERFLYRCYQLGKPFALLLPLTTLETAKRQILFRKYGVEIVLFDKRINFVTPSGQGSGAWFAVAWFTNWLNIGQALTFVSLDGQNAQLRWEID